MVFIVVLLAGEQLVRIIDIIEIQVQRRRCRVLKMGNILPLFVCNRVSIDGAPVVAGHLTGGVLIHQRRFDDVVPAFCDVPFPFPAHAVGHLFVERHRDGIAADQNGEYDRPFEPVDRVIGKHRSESLLDTQFQHLPRHLLCSSYDIWRRSARQNDTFDNELENLIKWVVKPPFYAARPSIPRLISYHFAAVCLDTPAPLAMAWWLVTSGWNFMYVPNCKPPHKSLATARKQLYGLR